MRLLASTCVVAALTLVTAAEAQPSSTSPSMQDARCLLAMVALSNSEDPNQQRMGQGGAIYFMGRIAGRDPNFDFASLKTLAASMDLKTAETDLQQRCGPMFNKSMQQVGSALGSAEPAAPPAARPAPPPPRKP
ncbi:hypothetical protein LJR219_001861 [Phenylobacterium sp. LjRoot219]|uniref:hypothetical protein n=1 Tax=Phenylobacterium sp. LjRoot219 TaxID=3342283 RepID=UPI003ECC20D9